MTPPINPTAAKSDATNSQKASGDSRILVIDNCPCEMESETSRIPRLRRSEVRLGKLLGAGSFCVVRAVKAISRCDQGFDALKSCSSIESANTLETAGSSVMGSICEDPSLQTIQEACQANSLAVKYLKSGKKLSFDQKRRGRLDLATEIEILSSLQHPHVVTIRGVNASSNPCAKDNFFVMDRLYGTLEEKIHKEWRNRSVLALSSAIIPGLPAFSMDPCMDGNLELLLERLLVAYQLSSAFTYLHRQRIAYRDLKQQNVGFDSNGDIKLFDFGLAKMLEYELESKKQPGTYRLTARTGTYPYMAPEVATKKPYYNEKCDVFSFAILLWEMLSLENSFDDLLTNGAFYYRVSVGGERPDIPGCWESGIKDLLRRCWNANADARPSFPSVQAALRKELLSLSKSNHNANIVHKLRLD